MHFYNFDPLHPSRNLSLWRLDWNWTSVGSSVAFTQSVGLFSVQKTITSTIQLLNIVSVCQSGEFPCWFVVLLFYQGYIQGCVQKSVFYTFMSSVFASRCWCVWHINMIFMHACRYLWLCSFAYPVCVVCLCVFLPPPVGPDGDRLFVVNWGASLTGRRRLPWQKRRLNHIETASEIDSLTYWVFLTVFQHKQINQRDLNCHIIVIILFIR